MNTELIEFTNGIGETLRGILREDGKAEYGVVLIHGFEGEATGGFVHKQLADTLAERGIASFRFDFAGCGLSDGDFSQLSVARYVESLRKAVHVFSEQVGVQRFRLFGHSLGGAVLARFMEEPSVEVERLVLLAPALNQRDILRYFFAQRVAENKREVTWENYTQFFQEEQFQQYLHVEETMMRRHVIGSAYMQEGSTQVHDLSAHDAKILHIHGNADVVVPMESLPHAFSHSILIEGGDHYLERPDFFAQWKDQAVDWLAK